MRVRLQSLIFAFPLFFLLIASALAQNPQPSLPKIHRVSVGMDKKSFAKIYPKLKARTYRQNANEQWLTFNDPLNGIAHDVITFHLKNDKVIDWKINNRAEVIDEYLGEFSSMAFKTAFPLIDKAIHDVLARIPFEDFLTVTDRRRPVLFTEVFDSGTAKFANSSEIISLPDDAPAFQDGLTIIKLSTGLEHASNQQAIEGVIAHELAHRVLEHAKHAKRSCAAEREANALIKKWGFSDEYNQASQTFGQKAVGQTISCQDDG